MSAEPVLLPAPTPEARRPPLPFVAAVIPVAAGTILWFVTGSMLSLCFALLGPLMIVGSFLDGLRQRRREHRRLAAETDAAWRRADEEITDRLDAQRARLWRRHPDVRHALIEPLRRDDEEPSALTTVVVGSGSAPSGLRLSGGDSARGRAARDRARTVDRVPVVVELGRGIGLRCPPVLADAAARALAAQLRLRFGAARLTITGARAGVFAEQPGLGGSGFHLSVVDQDEAPGAADATIRLLGYDEPVPVGITTVLEGERPDRMTVRTPEGVQEVRAEFISSAQAEQIERDERARRPAEASGPPERVALSELEQPPPSGLAVAIGRGVGGEAVVDLVADGPHAVVTGMTGSGKSELLVTWVSALCARRSPEEVTFVLADFKGGTAFDPLRAFPHVTAVLTDLDDEGAARGVGALTAELRRRERVLADAGARDVDAPGVRLSRLVIVVDEFAVLVQEHPDLAHVFTDIAARGRALGMHLVLGTQRATGVIRDSLAANCPLRISLRVAEASDSRAVIGTDDAAALTGGAPSRGFALIRRPQDVEPHPVRIALTEASELARIERAHVGAARPPSPWPPPLPNRLGLETLAEVEDGMRLGLADEPDRQRQRPALLRIGHDRGLGVVGGPGAGKTALIRALHRQCADATIIPGDPEAAWDAVAALDPTARGLVLCDDVDRIVASLPGEYALAFAERFELFLRGAPATTAVLTLAKPSGPAARLLDAVAQRMLLQMPTRAEHLSAGGDAAAFRPGRPPGRGLLAGREVQIAWTEPGRSDDRGPSTPHWEPSARLIGVIGGAGRALFAAFSSHPSSPRVLPVLQSSAAVDSAADVDAPLVLIGDAEDWQREWAALQRVRTDGEALVLAEQPAALRTLLGIRELAPYARTHAGRGWRVRDGARPERVLLPRERS